MKQATVKLIEEKFKKDIDNIQYEIRKNKKEINNLAKKQRELKDTRKGLYDILRLIS
jgi:DNA-binding transcriptional regulator GbsR (MarR family)